MNNPVNLADSELTLLRKIIEVYAAFYTSQNLAIDESFSETVGKAFFACRGEMIAIAKERIHNPEKARIVLGLDAHKKTFGIAIEYEAPSAKPLQLLILAIVGAAIILAGLIVLAILTTHVPK